MHALPFRRRLSDAISAVTAALAAGLSPVTPWLFIALRRALIPTVSGLALALLLMAVPQTREVLHGLSEPVRPSFTGFDPEAQRNVHTRALVAFLVAALAAAAALWHAARLLSTVEVEPALPRALDTAEGRLRLDRAMRWHPRVIGVAALAASVAALIHANYTPGLSTWHALALAAAAVVGPLAVQVGRLWSRAAARPLRGHVLAVVGGAVSLGAAIALFQAHPKVAMAAWSVGAMPLPALLLAALVGRRTWYRRRHPSFPLDAATPRSFGQVILTVLGFVAVGGTVLLLLAVLPTGVVRAHGSAATALWFLAAATLFLTGLQLVLRRVARHVPGFTTAMLALGVVLLVTFDSEGLGREHLDGPAPTGVTTASTQNTAAIPASSPQAVQVNAHGGGLRAAVYTAQVLARADDASCGRFGERAVAYSGVSGGSLGLATYLLAREAHVAQGGWVGCTPGAAHAAQRTPLADAVTRALVQDHLSPVIARMLAVDVPQLWHEPTRGQALLDSWQGAVMAALDAQFPSAPRPFAGLAMPLARLNGGRTPAPAVYFNATDADTGRIVWFSNTDGGAMGLDAQALGRSAVSIGQAVLHSARFPFVTPAGAFEVAAPRPTRLRLIDGGYADNSGATTLMERQAVPSVRLVNIDGNPTEDGRCARGIRTPPLLTGLRGLLQARAAQADRAVQRLQRHTGLPLVDLRLELEDTVGTPADGDACRRADRAQHPPLGWYMSHEAAAVVALSASRGVVRLCRDLDLVCSTAPVQAVAP